MENFNFPRTRVYKSFSVCKILTREEVEVRYYDVARMLPWIAKHFDSNELASSRKFDSNFNHRAFIYENNVAGGEWFYRIWISKGGKFAPNELGENYWGWWRAGHDTLLFWIPIGKPSGKCKIIHGVLLLCIASAATISPTVWVLHACATTVVISFSTRQVNYPTICVYYPNTRQTSDRDDCFLFVAVPCPLPPDQDYFDECRICVRPVFVRGITRSRKEDRSVHG